jgi:2-iminoacetate synthase ThiH
MLVFLPEALDELLFEQCSPEEHLAQLAEWQRLGCMTMATMMIGTSGR